MIENSINFYEKLETEISYLVKLFVGVGESFSKDLYTKRGFFPYVWLLYLTQDNIYYYHSG